ncbi:CopL family metal-binding regulatory protein [Stenotrophomonas koreensis]|uniref:CopL family metal-binding regulatory protein n=1 Tax=Stenotrophomonas koreensis TaxID=266128 RepID=UPI003393591C
MPVLLRVLLIVLLLVNTTASAWAASRMASSLLPAAGAAVDTGSPAHHAPVMAAAEDCHASAAASTAAMPCGADSQHCDCLQQGSALPAPALVLLLPAAPLAPAVLPARYSAPPRLAEPVRPPIPALS